MDVAVKWQLITDKVKLCMSEKTFVRRFKLPVPKGFALQSNTDLANR